MNVGIHGIGVYLPETIRRNDWWPAAQIAKWRERAERRLDRIKQMYEHPPTEGARMALAELLRLGDDPFQGGRERRVIGEHQTAADMEAAAGAEALRRAGIDPKQIDLNLSFTLCPDYINVPTACIVHHRLGLPERCMTLAVDAVCNSFMMQLSMAQEMIRSGRARYALLTQSSAITRLAQSGEHYDTWFGDAATAVVLGPVADGKGILAYSHHTDGSLHKSMMCGVPGARWFNEGSAITYSEDPAANYNMVVQITDRAKQVVDEALAEAGLSPDRIDFFACHQAFLWLRQVAQRHLGLTNARWVDTFSWAGTVSGANLPLVMSLGEREGLLKPGDSVALFQGGTGMTWSGMILRWGVG